jgi:hypothetical protein
MGPAALAVCVAVDEPSSGQIASQFLDPARLLHDDPPTTASAGKLATLHKGSIGETGGVGRAEPIGTAAHRQRYAGGPGSCVPPPLSRTKQ